jgi:transcriptional regulator with XRE-family HTH domain/mannose-6-phosphate isomerase-like protein (cupin superfamily)
VSSENTHFVPSVQYTGWVPSSDADSSPERAALPEVGDQIRDRRQSLGMSVRELARRLTLSPSLISQIERGKATPSVATLYAITTELKLSLDELFSEQPTRAIAGQVGPSSRPANASDGLKVLDAQLHNGDSGAAVTRGPVVTPEERKAIQLDSGVRWERLTQSPDPNVDFLFVVYEPGGASCESAHLMRHSGREYGHVLSGTLQVTVGFEDHVLGPGDSISFDSTTPHRLATVGDEPVEAIWFVVGRSGDSRFA